MNVAGRASGPISTLAPLTNPEPFKVMVVVLNELPEGGVTDSRIRPTPVGRIVPVTVGISVAVAVGVGVLVAWAKVEVKERAWDAARSRAKPSIAIVRMEPPWSVDVLVRTRASSIVVSTDVAACNHAVTVCGNDRSPL